MVFMLEAIKMCGIKARHHHVVTLVGSRPVERTRPDLDAAGIDETLPVVLDINDLEERDDGLFKPLRDALLDHLSREARPAGGRSSMGAA
jgi:hypothetical protein